MQLQPDPVAGVDVGSAVQTRGEDPAVIAFATAASGIDIAGVSAAFWALVAGLVVRLVLLPGGSDK